MTRATKRPVQHPGSHPEHDTDTCDYCRDNSYDAVECVTCDGTGGEDGPCENCDGHGFTGYSW